MLLWIIKFHISIQFFMVLFGKLSSYLYNCLFSTFTIIYFLFISYLFELFICVKILMNFCIRILGSFLAIHAPTQPLQSNAQNLIKGQE